jgi:putative tryptophan/tyrosine transport system substrate-binding protein
MKRREFIALAGAAIPPSLSRAQQTALPVIGYLSSISAEMGSAGFRLGLSEQGYLEGRNVRIEYRYADGHYDRLPALASELVSLPVTVIVALPSSPAALAAKAATSEIPIVFFLGADPVELGLVASYNLPGGNVTGVSVIATSLTPKRLELLDQLLPKSAPIAVLINPTNRLGNAEIRLAEEAARALGREVIAVGAGTEGEIDTAFETLTGKGAGGLVVWQESYFFARRDQIVMLARRHKLLAIYPTRQYCAAGGLISYGTRVQTHKT